MFDYRRRRSSEVTVGSTPLGAGNPIRIQSMTTTSTMDTDGSVAQALRIARAGGEYVRLTAQGVREAENLALVRNGLREAGCEVPLVADIHFNPRAAFAAAKVVEKVRINPGNFVDPGRTFKKLTYTDAEYAAELERIDDALTPFLELCREHGTAIRIGVNHGSLSDRIMSRFGDTPAGMVESAMEFLRVCVKRGFTDVVISMKASNAVVMVESVRRLVAAMDAEGMHFPLHLGVTEAGEGEDGRVKSAVGIGTLLHEGIGDTVRVSLSEEPEAEIPVARALVDYITSKENSAPVNGEYSRGYDSITPRRMPTATISNLGSSVVTKVLVEADEMNVVYTPERRPDMAADPAWPVIDASAGADMEALIKAVTPVIVTSRAVNAVGEIQALLHRMTDAGVSVPVIVKLVYNGISREDVTLRAAADYGTLLLNGFVDGVLLEADGMTPGERVNLSFGILQAARRRFTRTEFISCPGCGRTLFDLQQTVAAVKGAVAHLKGLKIGVMGCIVNGPGEMADADYGYVGAAAGHISLYRGKECIEKNIPTSDAIPRLIEILKADGVWTEPDR